MSKPTRERKGADVIKVRDVMTNDVTSCRLETNLAEAGREMWERDFRALPSPIEVVSTLASI